MKNRTNDPLSPFILSGTSPPESKQVFENKIVESPELRSDLNQWLTTNEAAEYLRISPASLRNQTSNGKVPYFKFGRLNRYRKSDLDKILLSQKRGGFL